MPEDRRSLPAPLAHRFVLISRWRLDCPAAAAWDLLTDLEAWPRWWPEVLQAEVLHRAPVGQPGTRARLTWRTRLGYRLQIAVTNTRRQRQPDGRAEIEGRSEGDLLGRGLWVLEPVAGRHVDVTYRYEVELARGWMRAAAPLLRRVFAWNHFALMSSGAAGMARHLACRAPVVDNWCPSVGLARS